MEELIRRRAQLLGFEISDSTIELMIQQLERNFFYTRSILDAAASRGSSLKTFMEFERIYVAEVLSGRINHYLGTLIRGVAKDSRNERAVLEALNLVTEAAAPVPIDRVTELVARHAHDPQVLLARMHARELLELSYGFVSASDDPVLADYVRETYRKGIAGAPRPVAGEELLSEKLKHSHRLMMSRYNRAVCSQLVELLSRFDFQSVPATLFHDAAYDKRYRGMSRVQVRRALDEEPERVRLPQIVTVHDLVSGEESGVGWRLFAATGFEGGIYTDSNEVVWMIALINSKEALDVETLVRIEQRLDAAARDHSARFGSTTRVLRWYVSKEGFSAVTSERLLVLDAFSSTYSHLDLIQDHLARLALDDKPRPASEFELVIPVEDEAELIAARTAEQIARAADFDAESINQIKTALIEACINAAEHGDAPDRKIHQHFAIDENKLIITVSNKGKTFGRESDQSTPSVATNPVKGTRGRGLQIIRALMDEVSFERTDDGARLVMTKRLKRPENQ
ncbi:MAG TPA: ATP-binding protein [Blastocatellia bacterium]|nr:ATP-binding protein [Blastocatellia bacterium]